MEKTEKVSKIVYSISFNGKKINTAEISVKFSLSKMIDFKENVDCYSVQYSKT